MALHPSEEFESLLRDSLPDYAADAFFAAWDSSARVSVRMNPFKQTSSPEIYEGRQAGVPWCSEAFFLDGRKQFTLDPAFHAGAYYVQDSSSMFLSLIEDLIDGTISKGAVLDLCASPGGKSTHLISLLKDRRPMVICNEAIGKRVPPLMDNIAKWGAANVLVTNTSAGVLGRLEGLFDVVLADVPCSGEGMFRKSEDALSGWSLKNVMECAALQRSIIRDIWPGLRPGGLLIYSTCTYNHLENEDNVKFIAEELGASIVPVRTDAVEGLVKLDRGHQFVPGLVPGEGQFFAVLRKDGDSSGNKEYRIRSKGGRYSSLEGACLKDCKTGDIHILPSDPALRMQMKSAAEFLSEQGGNCVRMIGCRSGQFKGSKFVPDADLALNPELSASGVAGLPFKFSIADIDRDTAIRFLSRENITPQPQWPRGYILLKYQSLGLGFVNNLGNRCNNLHPLMRRILNVR